MFHISKLTRNIIWRKYFIFCCMFGFGLLLVFGNFRSDVFYEKLKNAKNDFKTRSISVNQFQLRLYKRAIAFYSDNCTAVCEGNLKDIHNFLMEIQRQCDSISLIISNAIFPDDQLSSNWLKGTFNLNSIKITSTKLREIQNGAFDQETFENVTQIDLDNVAISILTEKTFVGLKSIHTFTLVNTIENFTGEAFLKPMMKTLRRLTIKHVSSTSTDPGPWLRGESFIALEFIVFEGCNFGEYINGDTFSHLEKLSTLRMNSCNITEIAEGSFDFIMKWKEGVISLENNQLKSLTGEYLSSINMNRRVLINNNPWDCTCKLKHLSKAFKYCPECFGNNSSCSTPTHLAGKQLDQINLVGCEDEPSIPPTTTNTNTSSVASNFIECTEKKVPYTSYGANSIELLPPDGHFTITSINENSVKLVFEDQRYDLALIWFYESPNFDKNSANIQLVGEFYVGCQSELDTSLIVEGLIANQSYTFCLVQRDSKTISPFNCKPYIGAVRGIIDDGIWLRKKDRPMAIGIFIGSIILSIFLGLIGMYILTLYNPWFRRTRKESEIDKRIIWENQWNKPNPSTKSSLRKSIHPEGSVARFRRFSTESGLSYMIANNYEELEYYKKNYNLAPRTPAPPLPRRIIALEDVKDQTLEIGNIYVRNNDDGYTTVV